MHSSYSQRRACTIVRANHSVLASWLLKPVTSFYFLYFSLAVFPSAKKRHAPCPCSDTPVLPVDAVVGGPSGLWAGALLPRRRPRPRVNVGSSGLLPPKHRPRAALPCTTGQPWTSKLQTARPLYLGPIITEPTVGSRPCSCDILQSSGVVPPAANCSLVVPIHKRGDVVQPTNYRPIAVGEPLTRLYGALLNSRLVSYIESHGLRAPSQTGFRPRLSTLHQIFALQHLIDRAVHSRQPLFCCFLDLKGAYDRVPRVLLWQALARLGVPDTLLAAIQSLYNNADYAISVSGRRGASARSACGVKQGCPLSPTLFGLLLDGLHWALMAGAPAAGPLLACGRRVPDLGYADDFCLLSSSPAGLQQLLHIAHGFLTSIGMELSLGKTRVVVFGAAPVDAGHMQSGHVAALLFSAFRNISTWVFFSQPS